MKFNEEKVQEIYPEAVMYKAQLINKGNEELLKDACESGLFFGELKKDGYWYQAEFHEHYNYLFSRTATRTTGLQAEKSGNVPHIMTALSAELPKDTILLGEIYYPNGTSKNVTSIMGCLPEKAIARQNGEYGNIHFYIHDIVMYNGIDFIKAEVGNLDRYNILKAIFEKFNLGRFDFLELAEIWTDNLYQRIGDALAAGEEGMVIKNKTALYEPGKRPKSNLKAKQMDFIDCVIMGFDAPTREYTGRELGSWEYWVNEEGVRSRNKKDGFSPVTKAYFLKWTNTVLRIGAYNKEGQLVSIGSISSGISDAAKEDFTKHPEKYLNECCSIQCMSLDKTSYTLRHGFFKGLRPDKNATDCTIDIIFGQ